MYILFLTSSYILGNCLNTNAGYGKQIYAFKHSFCVCFTWYDLMKYKE